MGYHDYYQKDILNTPHLKFIEIADSGRTKKYEVRTIHIPLEHPDSLLGHIAWYGSWRKYCFFPEGGTVFDDRCHKQIDMFMFLCKIEWKAGNRGITNTGQVCSVCMTLGEFRESCEDCKGTGLVSR